MIYLLTCNKCRKQYVDQTVFTTGGIIKNLTLVNMRVAYHACKNTCKNIFVTVNIMVLLSDNSMTFIEKADPTNHFQRKNYWKHTLKTFAPYGLNITENV